MRRARRRRVEPVTETGVYRTELGTIFRISESNEGHLSVQLLKRVLWIPGPIRDGGLRLAPTTARLTARTHHLLAEGAGPEADSASGPMARDQ